MKTLLLFSLCIFSSLSLFANQLKICNTLSDRVVFFSYMKQAGSGAGWQSKGWYKVETAKCSQIDLGNYVGKLYTYAEDQFQETFWGEGSIKFCVNKSSAFSYNNADSIACSENFQKRVSSDEVEIKDGVNEITLSPNMSSLSFCNQNSSIPVFASFARKVASGWESKGWFQIAPASCKNMGLGKYSGSVLSYAEYNLGDLKWGSGPQSYCVNKTKAFTLQDATNPELCSSNEFKMVEVSETQVSTGVNTINFEPKNQVTELTVCNGTSDKPLRVAYALRSSELLKSQGWNQINAWECQTIDLGSYTGESYIYAEWNEGELYWGEGPTNICVNRNGDFSLDDSENSALCNFNINNKMVPTTRFDLQSGNNTFTLR